MPILDHFLAIRTWILRKWYLTASFRVFVSSTRGTQSLLVLLKSINNVEDLLLVTENPHTMHEEPLK